MKKSSSEYDAVVIGSGPNGLAAAIECARRGLKTAVFEARDTVGGGMRSADLTGTGARHDICSAVHPLAVASPFFTQLPLHQYGLEWIQPAAAVAHPLDESRAAVLAPSLAGGIEGLGRDTASWRRLFEPFVRQHDTLLTDILGPLRRPSSPILLARFGRIAVRSALSLATKYFSGEPARALFAGLAGHAILPLERPITAAIGLVLGLTAHARGWPIPKGGAQTLADALVAHLHSLGGEVVTNHPVTSVRDLPSARIVFCDTSPRFLFTFAGQRLPRKYHRALETYRYGPGAFKVDWVLNQPIPFTNHACRRAGTVHLGGTLEEIARAEHDVWQGNHPQKPFVLLAQPSSFDTTRAPERRWVVWAYCHVPRGSTLDMTERIEQQIERFAPGFKDAIVARHTMSPGDFEAYNPNYVGGDINGGVQDWSQLFSRPVMRPSPYRTPIKGLYLCSSSTPPGGGVHGMCGYHAARQAIRDRF